MSHPKDTDPEHASIPRIGPVASERSAATVPVRPVPVPELDEDSHVPVRPSEPPLAETVRPAITGTGERPQVDYTSLASLDDPNESTRPSVYRGARPVSDDGGSAAQPHVALGETLQLVHYARRSDTLLISGITPHGRRLTFEQREDRQGWYVVAAGRRRRPTQRELGLVVATITAEMEAALIPERQSEVRSAYRLAVASDQPGLKVYGLEAYRDVLLDEAAAFTGGQTDRLGVVAVDYQAFKRFANRHGHRIGEAFVQALGELLNQLFAAEPGVQVFHKSGKSFRLVASDRSAAEVHELVERITSESSKAWLVERVWGDQPRTHPEEVNFHIGIAMSYPSERESDYRGLAQRLSDDAFRASKLGQLKGHTSIVLSKSDYRTVIYRWNISSEDELQELAAEMDDGPREVMAEMSDYLHELVPADLEGMAVAGDLHALVHCAIARDGFWQGTTAMRIAGDRLVRRFLMGEPAPDGEHDCVGGFDLGDEFYGIAVEGDSLFFARGDINSAGATRVRAGLEAVQRAVGWRREDGGGIVGRFLTGLSEQGSAQPVIDRIRTAANDAFTENDAAEDLHVNDAVDIADYLYTQSGKPVRADDVIEGAVLELILPREEPRVVLVESLRSGFLLRLSVDGRDLMAAISDSISGPQVKLRIRKTVASAAICVLEIGSRELADVLREVREDNQLPGDQPVDIIGFLRHITDILLEGEVKQPSKIRMALGARYDARDFVGQYSLEDVRERHPGLFYEAVHHDLLAAQPAEIDRALAELIAQTMLASIRPRST